MLQYRNTPDPQTGLSPAMCLFGRPIKDFIPILPGRYEPHPTWVDTLNKREEALRNRHMQAAERWAQHTKQLPPLCVGDHVRVQNQTGHHPLKWDKTGRIVEVRQFDQYAVRIDGSGRTSLRNRKFLQKFVPVQQPKEKRSVFEDLRFLPAITRPTLSVPVITPPASTVEHSLPQRTQIPANENRTSRTPVLPLTTGARDGPLHVPSDPPLQSSPMAPADPPTSSPRQPANVRKPPLALRRLMDHNSKGVKE